MAPRFFLHRAVGKKTPLSTREAPSPGCPQSFHVESTQNVENETVTAFSLKGRLGRIDKTLHGLPPGGEGTPVRTLGGMRGRFLGKFPGKLVLSLRQTDFQTLRAMKIGPLPCGGHASSATGGAVPARPLIRHGLRPCHLLPTLRHPVPRPVGPWQPGRCLAVPSLHPPPAALRAQPPKGKAGTNR